MRLDSLKYSTHVSLHWTVNQPALWQCDCLPGKKITDVSLSFGRHLHQSSACWPPPILNVTTFVLPVNRPLTTRWNHAPVRREGSSDEPFVPSQSTEETWASKLVCLQSSHLHFEDPSAALWVEEEKWEHNSDVKLVSKPFFGRKLPTWINAVLLFVRKCQKSSVTLDFSLRAAVKKSH